MADPKRKAIPLYQSLRPSGALRQQVAGVQAKLAPGSDPKAASATWLIAEASLGGIVPAAGDRCRGTDGAWWTVKAVGTLAGGNWPCDCEREGGDGA